MMNGVHRSITFLASPCCRASSCVRVFSLCSAHRLSTVQKCDQIVVMDRGAQIERGSHDELLEKNGAYANLSRAAGMKE